MSFCGSPSGAPTPLSLSLDHSATGSLTTTQTFPFSIKIIAGLLAIIVFVMTPHTGIGILCTLFCLIVHTDALLSRVAEHTLFTGNCSPPWQLRSRPARPSVPPSSTRSCSLSPTPNTERLWERSSPAWWCKSRSKPPHQLRKSTQKQTTISKFHARYFWPF